MITFVPLTAETWPADNLFFGLGILVSSRERRQLHVMALFRSDQGDLCIGDLADHKLTRRLLARPSTSIFWVAPRIGEEEQQILAAKVDAWLEENHGKIPYSVVNPGGVMFRDNVWIGDNPGQGLTCATFIAALFDELGYVFLDKTTWQIRPGDEDWAKEILGLLSAQMTPEHVQAQMALLGNSIRIRPSDIFAAGHLLEPRMVTALTYSEVDPGRQIVEAELLV